MKAKSKKTLCALLLISSIFLGYFFWVSRHPVEIISVHQRNNYSDVLVRNFPFTEKGKINWWLENRDILKAKYSIPKPASDGFYTIIFWDFGDGYKEEGKYDRLCFSDMNTTQNCIEKEKYMTIYKIKNDEIFFSFDGNRYFLNENNKIVKMKRE